jgi:hypothetical protein
MLKIEHALDQIVAMFPELTDTYTQIGIIDKLGEVAGLVDVLAAHHKRPKVAAITTLLKVQAATDQTDSQDAK